MHGEDKPGLGEAVFHNQTTVHPVGLALLILLGVALILLPRRRAMITVLLCASFIAVGQRVVVFTLDFNFMRLMVLFGWVRILLHGEYVGFRFKTLDYWIIAWAVSSTILYPISHGPAGIIYKLGVSLDSLGMYFLVRILVRSLHDVRTLVDGFAMISIPVACVFMIECSTRYNLFSVFGGVPEFTLIREGKVRCQGAYAHPILAGCFWAAVVPLLVGRLLSAGSGRILTMIGLFSSLAIIAMCSSSTPIAGVLAAMLGFSLFPLRNSMSYVRWTKVAMLGVLHLSMNQPVWHLVARTDLIGGSTGYHRFQVIDAFITHFRDWAICGIANVTHWRIFANDITNQYALEGIRAGGLSLAIFLTMIAVAFRNIGRLSLACKQAPQHLFLAWAIGVSMFVHTINFLGVAYFGQIDMLWYTSLALTAVVPSEARVQRNPSI